MSDENSISELLGSSEVKRLELKPGDFIILTTEKMLTRDARRSIEHHLRETFPGHKCLVLQGGMSFYVVEPVGHEWAVELITVGERWEVGGVPYESLDAAKGSIEAIPNVLVEHIRSFKRPAETFGAAAREETDHDS